MFECNGIHVPTVSSAQMREIDRIATEETGPTLLQMMENAGRSLASLAMNVLGENAKDAKTVVVAGTGGNGGGGICAARHLANRRMDIVLAITEPGRLSDAAALQRRMFTHTPGREIAGQGLESRHPDLILDAIIGYSLKGAPDGTALQMIQWANANPAPVLSLDVPSGVDADDGQTPGEFIRATWTMTLALPKTGLSSGNSGELWLADIGLPTGVFARVGLDYTSPFDNRYVVPLVQRGGAKKRILAISKKS